MPSVLPDLLIILTFAAFILILGLMLYVKRDAARKRNPRKSPFPEAWEAVLLDEPTSWWLSEPVDISSGATVQRDVCAILGKMEAWAQGAKNRLGGQYTEDYSDAKDVWEVIIHFRSLIAGQETPPGPTTVHRSGDKQSVERLPSRTVIGPTVEATEWLIRALARVLASCKFGRREHGPNEQSRLAGKSQAGRRMFALGEPYVIDLLTLHLCRAFERSGPALGSSPEVADLLLDLTTVSTAKAGLLDWLDQNEEILHKSAVKDPGLPHPTASPYDLRNRISAIPDTDDSGNPLCSLRFLVTVADMCRQSCDGDGWQLQLTQRLEREVVRDMKLWPEFPGPAPS